MCFPILRYICILLACLLFNISSQAQIRNCNAFIKSNYIEAGINWNGCFGSSTPPPAGFHPDTLSRLKNATLCGGAATVDSAIGFIADPMRDGMTIGSPTRFGDYILRGGFQEGWSFLSDGSQTNGWNSTSSDSAFISGMPCGQMNYSDTLGVKKTTWQGIRSGMYLTQFTTLDTQNMYISVQVVVENTTLATLADVFYVRTINAHPEAAITGQYEGVHKIEYSLPDSFNRSLVSTRGLTTDGAYISLGTQDLRAKPFICKYNTVPNANTIDEISYGDTNFYYNAMDSATGNLGIGLVFDLGNIVSGGHALFNFFYSFAPKAIDTTTSIADIGSSSPHKYQFYPNPTTNILQCPLLPTGYEVCLYNLSGALITSVIQAHKPMQLELKDLPPGCYQAVIKNEQHIFVQHERIIKW